VACGRMFVVVRVSGSELALCRLLVGQYHEVLFTSLMFGRAEVSLKLWYRVGT
jgi:hypothetical protein